MYGVYVTRQILPESPALKSGPRLPAGICCFQGDRGNTGFPGKSRAGRFGVIRSQRPAVAIYPHAVQMIYGGQFFELWY